MFMLSEGKAYLATFNEELKVFPAVQVVKDASGNLAIEVLEEGIPEKPHYRQAVTRNELFAKFGAIAPTVEVPDAQPDTTSAAQAEPDADADKPAQPEPAKEKETSKKSK